MSLVLFTLFVTSIPPAKVVAEPFDPQEVCKLMMTALRPLPPEFPPKSIVNTNYQFKWWRGQPNQSGSDIRFRRLQEETEKVMPDLIQRMAQMAQVDNDPDILVALIVRRSDQRMVIIKGSHKIELGPEYGFVLAVAEKGQLPITPIHDLHTYLNRRGTPPSVRIAVDSEGRRHYEIISSLASLAGQSGKGEREIKLELIRYWVKVLGISERIAPRAFVGSTPAEVHKSQSESLGRSPLPENYYPFHGDPDPNKTVIEKGFTQRSRNPSSVD